MGLQFLHGHHTMLRSELGASVPRGGILTKVLFAVHTPKRGQCPGGEAEVAVEVVKEVIEEDSSLNSSQQVQVSII